MNITAITTRERIAPDMADFLAATGHADLIPAPELHHAVRCSSCNAESKPAETEAQAIGLAFGNGWSLRVDEGKVLRGHFTASQCGLMEIICPACECEFATE